MGPLEVLKDLVDRFEKAEIQYFLVGSLAAMYYGRPRQTNDIDLVVQIQAKQLKTFTAHIDIEEYYCPPIEILQDEITRRGTFNLIHQESSFKIDIVLLKDTEFYQSEFSRRKKVLLSEAMNLEVYIASPEDIIIKKLDFYREGGSEKHLTDIRGIVAVTDLDQSYLEKWIARFGLKPEWEKV